VGSCGGKCMQDAHCSSPRLLAAILQSVGLAGHLPPAVPQPQSAATAANAFFTLRLAPAAYPFLTMTTRLASRSDRRCPVPQRPVVLPPGLGHMGAVASKPAICAEQLDIWWKQSSSSGKSTATGRDPYMSMYFLAPAASGSR
jgi:hypothetical protein